ncbi:uncharacterized protein C7orf57 homolog isoform X2 [Melanotaenia boesemani]|uniref:uncharacterized protein C7orf57 homolog isoform X2 n=1 Tax=Melanotaenia boesemani TaxID=1250792 RepID=UPI001C03DDAE|nr:uncharacterized protein C7orf57 homolog isoform X2 [Melanotaenia boesemani]
MNSENSQVLMSNDLEPAKSGVKTGYLTQDGHISQIPGLSPTISTLYKERAQGRRVAIMEGDSDYVKLAKQGGHKGLLWHEETITSTPNPYKPPDWFCTELEDASKPSDHMKNPGAFQPPPPPFGSDNMSAWERNYSGDGKEKNNDTNCSEMEEMQTSSQHHVTNKFKRIMFDKKPAPVDMSKLLRFGYAEDNKPAQ